MWPRPLALAAIISAFLCAATIAVWVVTASSTRRIILLNKNPSLYAWHEGIGFRVITSQGARSWDIGYFRVTAMTLLVPGIWLWRRLPRGAAADESSNPEVRALKKQIAFLVYLLIGTTAVAVDSRHPSVWVIVTLIDVVLIGSLVSRYRLNTRLKRLLTGCCAACGYNLTGNVTGKCPECGRLS